MENVSFDFLLETLHFLSNGVFILKFKSTHHEMLEYVFSNLFEHVLFVVAKRWLRQLHTIHVRKLIERNIRFILRLTELQFERAKVTQKG